MGFLSMGFLSREIYGMDSKDLVLFKLSVRPREFSFVNPVLRMASSGPFRFTFICKNNTNAEPT